MWVICLVGPFGPRWLGYRSARAPSHAQSPRSTLGEPPEHPHRSRDGRLRHQPFRATRGKEALASAHDIRRLRWRVHSHRTPRREQFRAYPTNCEQPPRRLYFGRLEKLGKFRAPSWSILNIRHLKTGPKALLVSRENPGLSVTASPALGAFNATAMANIQFSGCIVARENQLGPDGLGLLRVATASLSVGRVLVATGALAVSAAALDTLIAHANRHVVGRTALAAQQLVQKVVARFVRPIQAGHALAINAAAAIDARQPEATRQAIAAKLFAAETVMHATADALRLHGAAGLTVDSLVRRYAAKSQVYATIEGSVEALSSALGVDVLRGASDLSAMFDEALT